MKKVLIVEDEKSIATVISDSLKNEGFETVITHRGDEAIDCFYKEKPDLITIFPQEQIQSTLAGEYYP